jgi:hypothetical protein
MEGEAGVERLDRTGGHSVVEQLGGVLAVARDRLVALVLLWLGAQATGLAPAR